MTLQEQLAIRAAANRNALVRRQQLAKAAQTALVKIPTGQ